MKTFIRLFSLVGAALHFASPVMADDSGTQASNTPAPGASVFVIDDQTGEELFQKHGIQAVTVADFEVLINGVLNGTTPVHLGHLAVDEDVSDNDIAGMDFRLYAGGTPPKPPMPNLPLRQLATAMQEYKGKRAEWQKGILRYRGELLAKVESYVRQVSETQNTVAARFDAMLAARNGRDFNRSDIRGSVAKANEALGASGKRFLILNTDAVDLPGHREPNMNPLKSDELDTGITLIFVNTSYQPERESLFRKIANPIYHADSMKEAVEKVLELMQSDTLSGAE